jgi:hypothetical protein
MHDTLFILFRFWPSGSSVPGKEREVGGTSGSLSLGEPQDSGESWLRPRPQSPSTHNSLERYAKLSELPKSCLPRQASLQMDFYIYEKPK